MKYAIEDKCCGNYIYMPIMNNHIYFKNYGFFKRCSNLTAYHTNLKWVRYQLSELIRRKSPCEHKIVYKSI